MFGIGVRFIGCYDFQEPGNSLFVGDYSSGLNVDQSTLNIPEKLQLFPVHVDYTCRIKIFAFVFHRDYPHRIYPRRTVPSIKPYGSAVATKISLRFSSPKGVRSTGMWCRLGMAMWISSTSRVSSTASPMA
jgi:hypothetical protein